MKTDGTAEAKIRVRDLKTGNYLSLAATWTGVSTSHAMTETGTSFAVSTLDFQVPAVDGQAGQYQTTLSIEARALTADGDVYFDELSIWPHVNLMSIHGHNLAEKITPEWRSSTDNFSGSDDLEATLAITQPSFYSYLGTAVADKRYHQLDLNGTNDETAWLGELVLGYAQTLTRSPDTNRQPWVVSYVRDSVRSRTPLGEQYVVNVGGARRRVAGLPFVLGDSDELLELRDDIMDRCRHGALPIVIVPHSGEAAVIHGRVTDDALRVERPFPSIYELALQVEESPFPAVLE